MKSLKLLFFFISTFCTLNVYAQYFTVGPEVGYERTNLQIGGLNAKHDITTKGGNGYRIGVIGAYHFPNSVFIETGISYENRRGKIGNCSNVPRIPYADNIKINRAEFMTLPIMAGYELKFNQHLRLGVSTGPYLSIAIGDGNTYINSWSTNQGDGGPLFTDNTRNIFVNSDSSPEKITIKGSDRIDAGAVFCAYISWHDVRLRALYQFGMVRTIYNMAIPRTFSIGVAYNFKISKS